MLKTRKVVSMLLVVAMLAAMLVVGIVASSAAGRDYYLTGTVAGWGMDENFVMTATETEGEYVIKGVTLTTSDEIKAIQASKSGEEIATWYPDGMDNNVTVAEAGVYDIYFRPAGDGNEDWVYIPAGEHGCTNGGYLFYLDKQADAEDPTTDPDAPTEEPTPVETITITVKDEAGYGTVNAHHWGEADSTWPGDAMTDNGDGTFTAEIPAGTTGLVFNNGNGTQTENVESGIADGAVFVITADTDDQGHNLVTLGETEDPTEPVGTEPVGTEPVGTEPVGTEPAPSEDGSVLIDGVTYDAHVGDIIHYDFYLDMTNLPVDASGKAGYITELQGSVFYDKDKLTLTTALDAETDDDTGVDRFATLPSLVGGNIIVSNDDPAFFGYNAAKPGSGYKFTPEKVLVHLDFEVKAAGSSEIINTLTSLGSGDFRMVESGIAKETPVTRTAVEVECNHTTPTEPVGTEPVGTEPVGTEPVGTEPVGTEPVGTEPVVGGQSTITVVDWSGATETKVVEVGDEITVTSYLKVPDGKKVNSINVWQEFNIDADMVELLTDIDNDDDVFPIIDDATANVDGNIIKANATAAKYKQSYLFDSEDSILIQTRYKVVAEGNSKIKTDIITLATISEDQSMSNQILSSEKVGDDEIFTKTTLDAPEHETPTEPVGTEPVGTEPVGTEPVGTEPVGTEPVGTEPVGTEPVGTEPVGTEPVTYDGVLVIADGVTYAVEKDEIFVYNFYMTVPEKVHSLEGQTVYMTEGLQLQTDVDDAFPILGYDAIANEEPAGTILFNYSHAKKGMDFTAEDSVLVSVKFLVTAESGTYTIDTTLLNVAGPDEHKFIYDGEEVDEGVVTDTKLADEDGNEKEPYVGPTPKPTEPVGTEPVGTEPVGTEPVGTEPVGTEPVGTEPVGTEPVGTEPQEPASETSAVDPGQDTHGNPVSPQTGSTEIALIFLMILVLSAGVVVFVKKKRFN